MVARRNRDVKLVLQNALLPARLPSISGMHFDAVYVPSEHDISVGGDWYDAHLLADGTVLISIGDVMGHGMNAAAVMGQVRNSIATLANVSTIPPRFWSTRIETYGDCTRTCS